MSSGFREKKGLWEVVQSRELTKSPLSRPFFVFLVLCKLLV